MRIQRTIPPAAPCLRAASLWHALIGILFGERSLNAVQEELAEYFAVKHVFLVSSGKAALYLLLEAFKSLSPRREVVIPAYTCFSVPSAVVKAKLTIIPCDINRDTYDFDFAHLDKILSEDTLCVILHHLFGIPSDIDRTIQLCKDRGIFVIEDAAQAMGATYNGRSLGTFGDAGVFSLGRGKNITCGSGGIIVTDSPRIASAVQGHYSVLPSPSFLESAAELLRIILMAIFTHPFLYWMPAGLPSLRLGQTIFYKDFPVKKFSGVKAGLLHLWRETLEQSNTLRAAVASSYIQHLQIAFNGTSHLAYLRFPLLAPSRQKRDEIYYRSLRRGLGVGLPYPTAIHEIPELAWQFIGLNFPVAQDVALRLITLPTHHLVSDDDRRAICELLAGGMAERPYQNIEQHEQPLRGTH